MTLPATKIVPLHRADSSGSTFLFTSYLNAQDPSAWPASNVGTTVSWPSVPGALAETGSGGMVTGCAGTKGCIAYIGISYLSKTTRLASARRRWPTRRASTWRPTPRRSAAALASFSGKTPASGRQSLINAQRPAVPDHQLRVRDREEDAAERGRGNCGEERS